jgi:uncharacterized protein with von Willebrand factor type A (vWA) domain
MYQQKNGRYYTYVRKNTESMDRANPKSWVRWMKANKEYFRQQLFMEPTPENIEQAARELF